MKKFANDFIKSNNKIYFIIRNKGIISAVFAIITIIFGTYGFYDIKSKNSLNKELLDSLMHAFRLFGFNFPTIKEFNYGTIIGSIFAILTIALTAILFFFKDQINKKIFTKISQQNHIGIFGLGEISRTFLNDDSLDDNIIIIEKNNINTDYYRAKGYGIKLSDAFNKEFLEQHINFNKMNYALIAFGSDKLNIEFAKKIISVYKEQNISTPIKLIIHINDKNLSTLFNKNFMINNTVESYINLKTFSYFEESARDLFDKYSIDGDTMDYMESKKKLKTIVAGNGELIKRIIYKIIALSHFPNQNKHTICIVHKHASDLLEEIKTYIYYGKDKFPTIDFEIDNLDYNTQNFYNDSLWKNTSNLENIIICYEDERSNSIDSDECEYKNMFTFGNEKDIINKNHLINETIDTIAKLIHTGYHNTYKPNRIFDKHTKLVNSILEKNWFNTTKFSDKLSNISQARHINIKLKALGLKKIEGQKCTKKELLEFNRNMLNNSLEKKRGIFDDEKVKEASELLKSWDTKSYSEDYWITGKYNKNLFEKLLQIEHERWNTHHYLEGWKYADNTDKSKKEHKCIRSLEEFSDDIKITTIYDMYSFLYLPNYLAEAGYKIVLYS